MRNLEADGTQTQTGSMRYKRSQTGSMRYKRSQTGSGRYKAACAMMHTVDLAIIRVQTDK